MAGIKILPWVESQASSQADTVAHHSKPTVTMEYPLNILKQQRASLVRTVQEKTNHANSYTLEADALRARAADLINQAEAKDIRASRACELRNSFQASLNQVDAAIARLESE